MTIQILHNDGVVVRYQGLSTDTKPVPPTAPIASFLETDTGIRYIYEGATWVSRETLASKGVKGGYASLDAGGVVPDAQIPATIARDSELHARQHSVTSAPDHTFPGGETTYLRADGLFATPSGGAGTLVETHIPLVSLAVAQAI